MTICIQRDAPWSSLLLWAVTLKYYHTVSFLSCHGFSFCLGLFAGFFPFLFHGLLMLFISSSSSPLLTVEKLYPTYALQIIRPASPSSESFNNNQLFSVQQAGLQPCGVFLHSLKSSLLSGEESVSDVNVVLRVCKVF